MPRLIAPEGVTQYSHNGHTFEVGADGFIDVDERVAQALEAHGFKTPDAPILPTERVPLVTRKDLMDAMEVLGAAASPSMKNDALLAAFREATKARAARLAELAAKKQAEKSNDKAKAA